MLKFGYTLDLDFIDQIQNQSPEESKDQSKSMVQYFSRKLLLSTVLCQNKHQVELDRLDAELEMQKQLLKLETTQNTTLVTQLVSHKAKEVEELKQMMHKAQDHALEDSGGMGSSSRAKAVQLVQSQAEIILQLQRQIKQFKSKDTQIPIL